MNFFEQILVFLDGRMTTPTAFGWYHLMCLALVIAASVIVGIYGKKFSDKHNKLFLLILSSTMLILEVYKQLNFSFSVVNGGGTWDYQWYAFPFQFCSTPMYVIFIASLLKPGRVQDALYSFIGTFGLLAGALVMIMPGDVFISTIGINIQTMIVHGGMVVAGVYMLASGRVKLNFKSILGAIIVFAILASIALLLNIILYNSGVLNGETFNMFFISPYFPSTLPVFSLIYASVPYFVFLLLYLIGFSLGALIILSIAILIKYLVNKLKANKQKTA